MKNKRSGQTSGDEISGDVVNKALIIFEIMELLEKHDKKRDWLLHQLRKKGQKIKVSTLNSPTIRILNECRPEFLSYLLSSLKKGESDIISEVHKKLPESRVYHWFFTDIVHSSDPTLVTKEQAYKIIGLNKLIEQTEVFSTTNRKNTFVLPTGDGMAIGFRDSPEKPLKLAIQLHQGIKQYNQKTDKDDRKLYVRIGLHTGPVYIIKDLNGKDNVWGLGIIMARRVMDLARSMNILASDVFANDLKTLTDDYREIIRIASNYPIKYGSVLVYNIYGKDFGNPDAPPNPIEESTHQNEFSEIQKRFIYESVDLEIEIINNESMMAHHTQVFELISVTPRPHDRFFFSVAGDVPKNTLEDISLIIKDEKGNSLDITDMKTNEPLLKEFDVRLKEPIEPNQSGRIIKFEWDWEEKDRKYFIELPSLCKHFTYKLVVPKTLDIKHRVVRVEKTGDNRISTIPPTIAYAGDKVIITWSVSNIPANFRYRFDW